MAEFWFNVNEGKMIVGEAAYQQAVEQSHPGDIVSLPELLTTPDFPYKTGDFVEKGHRLDWTRQDKINLGHWALKLAEQAAGEPVMLTEQHMKRLHVLGLAPSEIAFRSLGNLRGLRKIIESPLDNNQRHVLYEDWSTSDFLDFARSLQLGRRIQTKDLERIGGPTWNVIRNRIGGLRELNELLGFPNIHAWDKDDYKAWGVKVVRANGESAFVKETIRILSRNDRGPSVMPIMSRFGRWSIFKEQILDQYRSEEQDRIERREAKLERYQKLIARDVLPAEFAELEESRLMECAGRFMVIRACAFNMPAGKKKELSLKSSNHLIPALRQYDPTLTAGHIETTAISYDVFDELWPLDESDRFLKVNKRELQRERTRYGRKPR